MIEIKVEGLALNVKVNTNISHWLVYRLLPKYKADSLFPLQRVVFIPSFAVLLWSFKACRKHLVPTNVHPIKIHQYDCCEWMALVAVRIGRPTTRQVDLSCSAAVLYLQGWPEKFNLPLLGWLWYKYVIYRCLLCYVVCFLWENQVSGSGMWMMLFPVYTYIFTGDCRWDGFCGASWCDCFCCTDL